MKGKRDAAIKRALDVKNRSGHAGRKRLRIAAVCIACALAAALALLFVHLYYCPLGYLWIKFSNPKIPPRQAGQLRVHFIDVGQGDGMIAELPDGRVMLIDGGNEEFSSRSALLRYANALGVKKFDFILATHPDSDHTGGLDDALRCFGAKKAFIPYSIDRAAEPSYASFLEEIAKNKVPAEVSHTYTSILSQDREYFYYMMFLSPLAPGIPGSYYDAANGGEEGAENDASAVLWLEYAGRSVLFTGDIGSAVEEKLVRDYAALGEQLFSRTALTDWGTEVTLSPDLRSVDFLKAAHHGSAGSSSQEFLGFVSPEAAFISAGAGNGYGHPAAETLDRFYAAGADVYRTDELGSIILTIGADGAYSIDHLGRG